MDHTKIYQADLESPRQKLTSSGLDFNVAFLVRSGIDFRVLVLIKHSSYSSIQ